MKLENYMDIETKEGAILFCIVMTFLTLLAGSLLFAHATGEINLNTL